MLWIKALFYGVVLIAAFLALQLAALMIVPFLIFLGVVGAVWFILRLLSEDNDVPPTGPPP